MRSSAGALNDRERFENVWSGLADGKSRKSMTGYINARINEDGSFLLENTEIEQCFCGKDSFFPFGDSEVFIDYGA